ncbi:LysR family transcriptional regulator [Agrobacterium rhizogenes]|uniref:Transcriptional regulator protein (Activator) n=1 Tax=Rhizobium rhizogenes (strain K84 / ATCC BAA-868) TaxID=311403 RepID=B9J823_RHIR8|nr:LysR family transcriptional regulator [Rhizobium rhizogenes]ACM27344.1 transcriptional regulator protein (activator) [Rhizobium rhizogenes K84]KAA6484786.1 transcriptional regulator GcvA [Agrobacterium sp. ICMP 7243]OCI92454.1 LysR family transcriptional regulator [Agrobacterium sp. 13-626]KEA06062.1 LysR family transcriptional regulator [Rhizobium rhizogenes]MDJ1637124.1 LysR family transcriptional regulator [Rhizobium rhizogenes]
MDISQLPLNALRVFEASARHGSFTRAGMELRVTQTAISHQVKALEEVLGITLFKRLPRGLALTDEGHALLPVLTDAFRRMSATLSQLEEGNFDEILTVGVVGTFAIGWLLPRLTSFKTQHPHVDLRLKTNNNRADMVLDGLDFFLRFGDGAWHGTEAIHLMDAPLSPVCTPALSEGLHTPADLANLDLLRSYRIDEWPLWFRAAGAAPPNLRGWMFDSSLTLVEAAARGVGAALVPVAMFSEEIEAGRIIQPFPITVLTGSYWLTRLKSRAETASMKTFRQWLMAEMEDQP